jgi:predicted tellurium resistance membrane protein TerC
VLGVAAASHGSILLLMIGLAISIPLIIFGSALILKVMDRYPVVITLGAALIGYVAGEMLVADAVVAERIPEAMRHTAQQSAAIASAALVVGIGLWLKRRKHVPERVIDVDGDPGRR